MNQLLTLQSLEIPTDTTIDRASSISIWCTPGANSGVSVAC